MPNNLNVQVSVSRDCRARYPRSLTTLPIGVVRFDIASYIVCSMVLAIVPTRNAFLDAELDSRNYARRNGTLRTYTHTHTHKRIYLERAEAAENGSSTSRKTLLIHANTNDRNAFFLSYARRDVTRCVKIYPFPFDNFTLDVRRQTSWL